MICLFNRKELLTTFSMEQQARVRDVLSANQIDYTIKTVNRTSPSAIPTTMGSRSRQGTFGINTDAAYEYVFYVKKKDYEKALHLIRK